MVGKKIFFSIILFLLLVSSVHATSLQDIGLYFNEAPVTHLRADYTLDADIGLFVADFPAECEPQGVTQCRIIIDVNGREYEQQRTNACEEKEGRYWCTTPYTISTQGVTEENSITTTYDISFFQGTNRLAQTQGEFVTTIDNTNPQLSKLETGFCQEGTCFVGSHADVTVRAEFSDEMTAFYQQLVRFDIGGRSSHAQRCGDNWCETTIRTTACSHESLVPIRVVDYAPNLMPSMEDARNPVQNLYEINAKCDANAPEVTDDDIRLVSRGSVPFIYETGSALLVDATARDMPGGRVTLYVESDNLTDDEVTEITCSETTSGAFVCEDEISNLNAGTHDIAFVFVDGAGNEVTITRTIVVLQSEENNEETDFITLHVDKITPDPINRIALQLATENTINYPVVIDYTLRGSNDAQVVAQSLNQLECIWAQGQITNESEAQGSLISRERSSILKPEAGVDEQNRFFFNFRRQAGELPDNMHVRCSYDVYVTKDGTFYPNPERETFDFRINFRNAPLGQPGQAFVDEIKRAEGKIDGSFNEAVMKMAEIGAYADQICGGYYMLTAVDSAGTALQATVFTGFGAPIAAVGDAIKGVTNPILIMLGDRHAQGELAQKQFAQAMESGNPAQQGMAAAEYGQTMSDLEITANRMFLPNDFSIRGICDWWSCAQAAQSEGFLGGGDNKTGLSCSEINSWLSGSGGPAPFTSADSHEAGTPVFNPAPAVNYKGEGDISTPYIRPGDERWGNLDATQAFLAEQGDVRYCAPNYEDSMLTSLGLTGTGFCARGVLHNFAKWQGIDCGYVACLKEQSLTGASINVCKQAHSAKMCTTLYGEIFELPIVNVFTRTSRIINARVQDMPMELVMTVGASYCRTGSFTSQLMLQQIGYQIANAATSGALDAVMTAQRMIARVSGWLGFTSAAADAASGAGQPVVPQGGANWFCQLASSVYRVSDVARMVNSAGTIGSGFEEPVALCEAAKSNNPADFGVNRGSALGQITSLGHLQAERRAGETSEYEWFAQRMQSRYTDAQVAQQQQTLTSAGITDDKAQRQAALILAQAIQSEGEVNNEFFESNFEWEMERHELTAAQLTSAYTAVRDQGLSGTLRYDQAAGTLVDAQGNAVVDFNDPRFGDGRTTALERQVIENYCRGQSSCELGPQEFSDLVRVARECGHSCLRGGDQAINDWISTNPRAYSTTEVTRALTLSEEDKSTKVIMENVESYYRSFASGNSDAVEEYSLEINTACLAADGLCNFEADGTFRINTAAGTHLELSHNVVTGEVEIRECSGLQDSIQCSDLIGVLNPVDEQKSDPNAAFRELIFDYVAKWLRDQGYFDNLKLSSWGSWGEESAARADKMFNPDSWARNFCSADMELITTNDEPLLALGLGAGPVLTFTGEIRSLPNGTNIYTVSYFIRTDSESAENTVWIKANPGDETIALGESTNPEEEPSEVFELPPGLGGGEVMPGQEFRDAFSFESEQLYEELCVVFENPFPNFRGKRTYCRPFVEDAFSRGGIVG